ncbi:MAG: DUF4174 domain-containing protein [Rhodobacteraceae bacterium]|nr:DUF4174 domain-containing protein [Paracoccaceae bacterium]
MTRILAIVLTALIPFTVLSQEVAKPEVLAIVEPAGDSDLNEFLWTKRVIVVFADSPADPRYIEQIDLLNGELAALGERDVLVLTDTDPKALSPIRTQLRPRGFSMVLIGKDGGVKLRKPRPWSVREISRSIDKFPDRQREVEDRRTGR